MKLRFSGLLLATGLSTSFLSCTDHRLGIPLASTKLRIKTLQATLTPGGSGLNTYSYDSKGRLTSIKRLSGELDTLIYGDPAKKFVNNDSLINRTLYISYANPANRSTGQVFTFPQDLDGTSFQAGAYRLTAGVLDPTKRLGYFNYGYDATKHLTSLAQIAANLQTASSSLYGYAGGNNITTYSITTGGSTSSSTLTYDTNFSPFYGLLDPTIDNVLTFSPNNPLTNASSVNAAVYTYEYNQQGYPTKRTTTTNGKVTEVAVITYESF